MSWQRDVHVRGHCAEGTACRAAAPRGTLARTERARRRACARASRWLLFRIMLGAGLIKIRGDECWRDLTVRASLMVWCAAHQT